MNEQSQNKRPDMTTDENRRLESLLASCRLEPVDNTRIKSLVREKIMREKMARTRRLHRILWGSLSAAACLAVLVTLAVKFNAPHTLDLSGASQAEIAKAGYKELIVAPGKKAEITLPDGSLLIANAHSRVLYPERFEGNERRIFATGEVYLEVTKDARHPFVVESGGFDVRVLGTVFNICNTSDSTASVVLVEGAVEVNTDIDRNVRLKPNDMVTLVNGEVASLQQVDPNDYTLWTKGLVALHGESLGRLAQRLSEHYGIPVSCDTSIAGVKVYGKLDLRDSIDHVLKAISEIVPMEIERGESRITMKSCTMKR